MWWMVRRWSRWGWRCVHKLNLMPRFRRGNGTGLDAGHAVSGYGGGISGRVAFRNHKPCANWQAVNRNGLIMRQTDAAAAAQAAALGAGIFPAACQRLPVRVPKVNRKGKFLGGRGPGHRFADFQFASFRRLQRCVDEFNNLPCSCLGDDACIAVRLAVGHNRGSVTARFGFHNREVRADWYAYDGNEFIMLQFDTAIVGQCAVPGAEIVPAARKKLAVLIRQADGKGEFL